MTTLKLTISLVLLFLFVPCVSYAQNWEITDSPNTFNTQDGFDFLYGYGPIKFPSVEQFSKELDAWFDKKNHGYFYKGYMYGWKIKLKEAQDAEQNRNNGS
jgi:hypothetical protein